MSYDDTPRSMSFFELGLWQMTDPDHPLLVLARKMPWERIEEALVPFYSRMGRNAKPVRLMAGLMILKHRFDLSDRAVVGQLHENHVWMAFCGVSFPEARLVDHSSLCRFRQRLGPDGTKILETVVREALSDDRAVSARTMIVDTTAMEKNVAYPFDLSLLTRGRERVLKAVRKLHDAGVSCSVPIRSFVRVGKRVLLTALKLGRHRKDRIREASRTPMSFARHVLNRTRALAEEAQTRIRAFRETGKSGGAEALGTLVPALETEAEKLSRVVFQTRDTLEGTFRGPRLYSLHEPEVVCISKGKLAKPHEYGSKVALSIDAHGFVIDHAQYADNRHDTRTLPDALSGWEEAFGTLPDTLVADRGYHARAEDRPPVLARIARVVIPARGKKKRDGNRTFRKYAARRSVVEAVIAHLKQDHRMNRCRYKGFDGDRINVSWAVLAWNTKKWTVLKA